MYTAEQLQAKDWFAFQDAHRAWCAETTLDTPWDTEVMDWWEDLLAGIGIETDRDCWTVTNSNLWMDAVWRHEPEWKRLIVTQYLEPELRSSLLALGAVLESVEELYPQCCIVMSVNSDVLGCAGFGRNGEIIENELMEQIILEHGRIVLRLFMDMLAHARSDALSEAAFIRECQLHGWLFDSQGNRVEPQSQAA